jgi:hypothetical protein
MARSRVYGGIHFSFDSAAGQHIGADVAGYVMENYLLPTDSPGNPEPGFSQAAASIAGPRAATPSWATSGTGGAHNAVVFDSDDEEDDGNDVHDDRLPPV